MFEKIAKTITNIGIIAGAIFLIIKSYLPNNDVDSDFSYFFYYVSRIRLELLIVVISILYLLNPNWIPFLNYKKLSRGQLLTLISIIIFSSIGLFFLRKEDLYGIAVQKKLYYTHTVPNNYFKFLLSQAIWFEKKGNLSEAKTYYERLQRLFPNNSDSKLIVDRIKRIENRKILSNKYYRNYEKFKVDFSKERIQSLIYAYYLNPKSEEIKKSVKIEHQRLNKIFLQIEQKNSYPKNNCALYKAIKNDSLLQFVFDKRVLMLDYNNSDPTNCFTIYIPSIEEIKKSWFIDDLNMIYEEIE